MLNQMTMGLSKLWGLLHILPQILKNKSSYETTQTTHFKESQRTCMSHGLKK